MILRRARPSADPYSYVSERLREQVLSAEEKHIFAKVVNIARFGYSRANYYFYGYVPAAQQALTPSLRAGVPTYAVVIAGSTASNGASSITTGGANVGSNNGITRNLFTLDDHAYYTVGKHSIQGGVWVQRAAVERQSCAGPVWAGVVRFAKHVSGGDDQDIHVCSTDD